MKRNEIVKTSEYAHFKRKGKALVRATKYEKEVRLELLGGKT